MNKTVKIFLLFFCLGICSSSGFSQASSILKHDTTFFSGGGGHIAVQLFLSKEKQTFFYTYRDDLWMRLTEGKYEISNDSIFFKCRSNCEDWSGSVLGPIVVEGEPLGITEEFKFTFISTAEDTLNNFIGKVIDSPEGRLSECGRFIEISRNDSLLYLKPLRECEPSFINVYIPVDMIDPQLVSFKEKTGIIKNGKIMFNEFEMTYSPLNHQTTHNKRR